MERTLPSAFWWHLIQRLPTKGCIPSLILLHKSFKLCHWCFCHHLLVVLNVLFSPLDFSPIYPLRSSADSFCTTFTGLQGPSLCQSHKAPRHAISQLFMVFSILKSYVNLFISLSSISSMDRYFKTENYSFTLGIACNTSSLISSRFLYG